MTATKGKRPTYDDQFRASAVLMLKSQGYPDVPGALTAVANHLKVPAMTLSRWFKGTQNPPPTQVVNDKRKDMRALFLDELYEIFKSLPDKRADASYGTLSTASGIFFDKIRLLDGLPTEIIAVAPVLTRLNDLVKAQHTSLIDALEAYYQALSVATKVEQLTRSDEVTK